MRALRGSGGEKAHGLLRGRAYRYAFATLLCAVALVPPADAAARDLVVYGEPTLQAALKSIGLLWQARTGTRVNVFVAPTDLSYAQIDRGARCDVIFALAGAATAMNDVLDERVTSRLTDFRQVRHERVVYGFDAGALNGEDAHAGATLG